MDQTLFSVLNARTTIICPGPLLCQPCVVSVQGKALIAIMREYAGQTVRIYRPLANVNCEQALAQHSNLRPSPFCIVSIAGSTAEHHNVKSGSFVR